MSKLLVVEDEVHIASGLRFNLEAEGHEVTLADTGEAALELIARHPARIDLVVLDVMLPGIDGFGVASQMRSHGWLTPILMLTARGRAEDVLRGFEAGADDYLPKPFELTILLARINALLRRHAWHVAAGASQAPSDAHGRAGHVHIQRQDGGLRRAGTAGEEQEISADADGGELTALSAAARRQGGVAEEHAGGRVEPAGGYRHARHRSFHRAPEEIHREGSLPPAPPADGPGRRLPVRRIPQDQRLTTTRQTLYGINVNFAWFVTALAHPSNDAPGGRTLALMRT